METTNLSIVFSWQLPEAEQRIRERKFGEDKFIVGGPAVKLNPGYFGDLAVEGGDVPGVLQRHNPQATRTSLGCMRKCRFCAVPKIEGNLIELDDWPLLPIVCDNNLLACSLDHFDRVIDRLKNIKGCDFNQGLDARLLSDHHAKRLSELVEARIRLSWDHLSDEQVVFDAIDRLLLAGVSKSNLGCYVLIGWDDNPEDALYRLEKLRGRGIRPNPMRYQPLDCVRKNSYVGDGWTHRELQRYMRYWSRLNYLSGIPFKEFTG